MKLLVCVSFLPRNSKQMLSLIGRAETKRADFIEVRTDRLDDPKEMALARRATSTPLIATDRTERKIGARLVKAAAEEGFDYVDIDATSTGAHKFRKLIGDIGAKAIVSTHAIRRLPSEKLLSEIFRRQQKLRPNVSKIVTGAGRIADNIVLLNFVRAHSNRVPLIAFAVGNQGRLSRVCSPIFGAFFTIAALERGRETAPGQLTIDELREAWGVMRVAD